MGMESGDDVILQKVCKGTNAAEIVAAGSKLKTAGIEVSEYYIIGLGGLARWREHAENSARVLSAFSPEFIRLRTLALEPDMLIWAEIQKGDFIYLTPHQSLLELKVLIENLDCQNSLVLSDHVTNYINVNGLIPRDRERMLAGIERALQIDEKLFRAPDLHHFK
jgi:radical SAM superfamily enzyme